MNSGDLTTEGTESTEMLLLQQVATLRAERDEADRRAGAAERQLAMLLEMNERNREAASELLEKLGIQGASIGAALEVTHFELAQLRTERDGARTDCARYKHLYEEVRDQRDAAYRAAAH